MCAPLREQTLLACQIGENYDRAWNRRILLETIFVRCQWTNTKYNITTVGHAAKWKKVNKSDIHHRFFFLLLFFQRIVLRRFFDLKSVLLVSCSYFGRETNYQKPKLFYLSLFLLKRIVFFFVRQVSVNISLTFSINSKCCATKKKCKRRRFIEPIIMNCECCSHNQDEFYFNQIVVCLLLKIYRITNQHGNIIRTDTD